MHFFLGALRVKCVRGDIYPWVALASVRSKAVKVVCWFVLLLYVLVNSHGHGDAVSSPNHTFIVTSLNKGLTNNSCKYFHL